MCSAPDRLSKETECQKFRRLHPALPSPPRSAVPPRLSFALLPLGLLCLTLAAGCNRPHQPDVVATVNGHPIDQATLERYYRTNLGNSPATAVAGTVPDRSPGDPAQLIDDDIKQQRAAKLNLVATDEEVDAKLAEIKAPYTQEEFNRQLKAKNMTLDDLKRQIRQGLTNEKLMNKEINSKINITDADITRVLQREQIPLQPGRA